MPSWSELRRESWSSDVVDVDFEDVDPPFAGVQLAEFIITLKMDGILSAKQACSLAFWAARSGSVGQVHELGLRPDQASGEYSRHVDAFVGTGIGSLDCYEIQVARRLQHDASRRWEDLPSRPPHECLEEELLANPEMVGQLQKAIRDRTLPERYFAHPAVRDCPAGCLVHPTCLYMDGVAFTRTDNILGFYIYFCCRASDIWCLR